MTRSEIIDGLEIYTVGRLKKDRVCITVEELQNFIDAIKVLNQESCEDWYDVPSDEMTLGQARQAVKDLRKKLAEHLEQAPCEDAVSRKAVLDYIYNDLGLGDEENGKDVERQMELEKSYKYVKSLSPVTPQQKMGATNGDVIKAMFPNLRITVCGGAKTIPYVMVIGENYEFNNTYPLSWWSAPYKGVE